MTVAANTPTTSPDSVAEPWTALAAWAADELGQRLSFDGERYRLDLAPDESDTDGDSGESALRRSWFRRRAAEPQSDAAEPPEAFVAEHPADIVAELLRRLADRPAPPDARPHEQPEAVHELAERLFAAYQLDGGRAHLAGCHLEDTPLVRVTRVTDGDEDTPVVTHRFFDELGHPLDAALCEQLGLHRVRPMDHSAPRLDAGRLQRMVESAERSDTGGGDDLALRTVVWAKRASGRLRFEFGEASVDTEFEGWARTLDAPAVTCPLTGEKTFHLATVEGGAIAAAEQVGVCAVSGHRHVLSDLVRCTATDQLVEPEYVSPCGATGEPVLKTELVRCKRCGLRVAPSRITGDGCEACSSAARVAADDERLVRIFDRWPTLRGKRWALAETPSAYVLLASGWFRQRVVTLDRESLEVLHSAEASRMAGAWRPTSLG